VLRLKQSNKGCHKLTPPWEGPFIVVEVLKPGTYKLPTRTVKSSPTLGTLSSYVTFTLKLPSFVHIFISKAIKKHSLLITLSRINVDLLAGTEASLLNRMKRARPGHTTGRTKPPSGAKGDSTP
jgi:hypothetical protein